MKAYSTDLRERVVAACDASDATRAQVAARFSVSVDRIRKLMRQCRETGSIAPKPHGGGHASAFDAEADRRLREAIRADDDATLRELAEAAGVASCASAVHRALKWLGITRKKVAAGGRAGRARVEGPAGAWRDEFAGVDPGRLVFVDETGSSTAMDRTHGRAPCGVRVDDRAPHGHWKAVTLTAAVRLGGVEACLAFDGATDSAAFETYVERCLAPTLCPGDVVILVDLACHKTAEAARLIAAAGADLRFLTAHSPGLNPIERKFSKLKARLRSAGPRPG